MTAIIQVASERLAHAEHLLVQARQRHQEKLDAVDVLRDRLTEVARKKDDIRARLDAGKLTDQEAGGLFELARLDEIDLRSMIDSAERDAMEADPIKEVESMSLAQAGLQRAEAQARYDGLGERIQKLEAALIEAIAQRFVVSQQLCMPRGLSSAWRPCKALERAIQYGVVPPVTPS